MRLRGRVGLAVDRGSQARRPRAPRRAGSRCSDGAPVLSPSRPNCCATRALPAGAVRVGRLPNPASAACSTSPDRVAQPTRTVGRSAGPTPSTPVRTRGARFEADALGGRGARRLGSRRGGGAHARSVRRARARGEVDLDQVRSQHLDGANRQPRGAVLGARFQGDARHLGSARAPVEDVDVDRRGAELGADLDDRVGVARGRDRFQPGARIRRARGRTGGALGERDVEPERQQLPVEPRDRFGQLGRSACRPDDDDRGRLGARCPEQHERRTNVTSGVRRIDYGARWSARADPA